MVSKRKHSSGRRPIAVRLLQLQSGGASKDVKIEIFAPRKINAVTFLCAFKICGLGTQLQRMDDGAFESSSLGYDSVQALVGALKMIEDKLDPVERALNFEESIGTHGFPLIFELIGAGIDWQFRKKIKETISLEIDKHFSVRNSRKRSSTSDN